jgi:ATP-dependent exoDNAse (exonuclease V) beta subunit
VPPFNRVPFVPVVFGSGLANTIFEKDYYNEVINLLIDNLNLVYVAFTRAVSVLMVNMPLANNKGRIGTFADAALKETAMKFGTDCGNDASVTYALGKFHVSEKKDSKQEITGWNTWTFNDFSKRLKIRTGQEDLLYRDEKGRSRKNSGRIIHHILSRIKIADDIDLAVKEALAAGMLLPGEEEEAIRQIRHMTDHPEAKEWFTGKWKVMTETSLLTPHAMLRPDRIMISEGKAVVVDFKSGLERIESHRRQVQLYTDTLGQAGFGHVSGYIWYIRENELVRI